MASEFLQETAKDLKRRRVELAEALAQVEPMRDELERIDKALVALNGAAASPPRKRAKGKSAPKRRSSPKARRAAANGKRSRKRLSRHRTEFMQTLVDNPAGVTIKSAGAQMKMNNVTPLYGLAKDLAGDGLAVKQPDKTWKPTDRTQPALEEARAA